MQDKVSSRNVLRFEVRIWAFDDEAKSCIAGVNTAIQKRRARLEKIWFVLVKQLLSEVRIGWIGISSQAGRTDEEDHCSPPGKAGFGDYK